MNGFEHSARLQAALQDGLIIRRKVGIVTSYDPDTYRAKVRLQPEDILTGWLPITSQWVGSGWGVYMPPTIGQDVRVEFVEGHIDAGEIVGAAHSSAIPPLSVPSGAMLVQHAAGSLLQFNNDGTVDLISAGTLTSQAPQWNHTGPVAIDGDVSVTGTVAATKDITTNANMIAALDISDQNGAHGTVGDLRSTYDTHDHPDPEGGNTGTPNQTV